MVGTQTQQTDNCQNRLESAFLKGIQSFDDHEIVSLCGVNLKGGALPKGDGFLWVANCEGVLF